MNKGNKYFIYCNRGASRSSIVVLMNSFVTVLPAHRAERAYSDKPCKWDSVAPVQILNPQYMLADGVWGVWCELQARQKLSTVGVGQVGASRYFWAVPLCCRISRYAYEHQIMKKVPALLVDNKRYLVIMKISLKALYCEY